MQHGEGMTMKRVQNRAKKQHDPGIKCYKEQHCAGDNMVEGRTRSRRQLDMKIGKINSRKQ